MMRSLLALALLSLLVAPAAAAQSLPERGFGEPPGPPLLHAEPPDVPELSVAEPFAADPLLVSGSDAYREGEYLYQDYLFDDHGADTIPGMNLSKPGPDSFSPAAGDVAYPTGDEYRANAADIAELRILPQEDDVLYRVTLTTVVDDDAAIVGIGIDEQAAGGAPVDWPAGAGITSPGLDRFITAAGDEGALWERDGAGWTRTQLPPGSVETDPATNQMTITVPRSEMDPGDGSWRYVAGAGVHDGAGGFEQVEPGATPRDDAPTSGGPGAAPAVFNLAFRFDEPQGSTPEPGAPLAIGTGNWFESRQARVLAGGTSGGFHADVDFAELAGGADRFIHAPGRTQARVFGSGLDLPEGVVEEFPEFGGRLQPYLLTVPESYRAGRPTGLTFTLHSLGGTYTQYEVFSPRQNRQFGDRRDNLVVSPLGRGPDGWYTDEGEVDFFEVWRDVADGFSLDPDRTYLTGYSMGGYGSYKLGTQWPDLFARSFTTVGPPGLGVWLPPAPPQPGGAVSNSNLVLENVRSVPYMNWVGLQDQLVPYPGPTAQQNRFDRLGLRSTLETFQGEHFTLAILDEWGAAADFLGDARVERRPSRVDYAFLPEADRRDLGLVHDGAYWVSDLRARMDEGDPETDPARAEINALSEAFGEGAPRVERVVRTGTTGRPTPSGIRGTRWAGLREEPRRNRLVLRLDNVRRATIEGRGARLDGDVGEEPLFVRIAADGPGSSRLELPLPPGAVVRRIDGPPVSAASAGLRTAARAPEVELDRGGATFAVARGEREYRIGLRGGGGDQTPGGGSGGGGSSGSGSGSSGQPVTDAAGAVTPGAALGRGDEGDGLPFTGLGLAALALAALALLGTGRALRTLR